MKKKEKNIYLIILFVTLIFLTLIVINSNSEEEPYLNLGDSLSLDVGGSGGLNIYIDKSNILIYAHITEYSYNNEYILIVQKPLDSLQKYFGKYASDIFLNKFKNSNWKQYWIIDKINLRKCGENKYNENEVKWFFGPFDYYAFIEKKKKLGVPDSLKFVSTKEFVTIYNE